MKKIFSVIAAGLAIVACSKPEAVESVKGEGRLALGVSVAPSTKAALSAAELESSAKVSIYKADFSGLVREYTYGEMPEVMYLAADQYRVDVLAGEAAKAAPAAASWEQKSYKGSKAFEIKAGQTTNVEVVANVNNAVTNISFDASVAENFNAGYTFSIALDPEDESTKLVYDASKSGKDGYFIIAGLFEPSFSWTFTGILAKDGSEFTKSGVIENLEAGRLYKMALRYTIKDGDLDFSLVVDYGTDIVDDTIIFEPVSTGLASSNAFEIWAGHATVHADVDESEYAGAEVKFAYSADGVNWTEVAGVNGGNGAWSAVLTGLQGSTEYTYKLIIDGEEVGEPKTLTTEAATRIPNGGFEAASKVSGQSYYKFYDPNASFEDGRFMFWGSGNGEGSEGVNGSASMGIVITAVDTDIKVEGNQSVRAQSSSMVGILAAGNIFTGQFAGLVGTSGGKVNFGRPWTTRPTAMRLWVRYTTDKINILKNLPAGVNLTKNDYDRGEIKFAIGTWDYKKYGGTKDSPVLVNTTNAATFVDYNTDPSTIAYSNIVIYNDGYMLNGGEKVTATTNDWFQITLPLDYHTETAYPTHIIVSCASSQYGDYFTGCDSSKLWIDAVELLYE